MHAHILRHTNTYGEVYTRINYKLNKLKENKYFLWFSLNSLTSFFVIFVVYAALQVKIFQENKLRALFPIYTLWHYNTDTQLIFWLFPTLIIQRLKHYWEQPFFFFAIFCIYPVAYQWKSVLFNIFSHPLLFICSHLFQCLLQWFSNCAVPSNWE